MVVVIGFSTAVATNTHAIITEVLPKIPVAPGWGPAAYMGAIGNVIMALIGGGALRILSNHVLTTQRINKERTEKVDGRADGYADRLNTRVDNLERMLNDERSSHVAEIKTIHEQHANEIAAERHDCDKQLQILRDQINSLQDQMRGFMRGLAQYQQSATSLDVDSMPAINEAIKTLDKHPYGDEEKE